MPERAGAPVSSEVFEAGVRAVMDYFPAEWGSRRGIKHAEAASLLANALTAMGLRRPT